MDELVRHCIREIAFDGDLGCGASRLRVFVTNFYENHPGQSQNLDSSFHAFVWSLLVQQPTIQVGRLPRALTTDVYIAPQPSAVKKGKTKAETTEEAVPRLELIPDAHTRSLDDLTAEFGDPLRIAVDPEEIYAVITGSHIRPQKMTPMVYTALQLITRGREEGITVVELGQRSKYDQKTCFYLVKQLIDLNLIAKIRCGGVGTNLCIHRHFYDQSPRWKEIREEELRAKELFDGAPDPDTGQTEDAGPQTLEDLGFTSIDARHLSSLPLIKGRVIKLLKASHNHIHASNNMLIRIGFAHPTKTDRRFFNTRIRELVQLGLIEAILVPSRRKGSEGKMTKCFRLVTPDQFPTPSGAIAAVVDDDDDEKEDADHKGGLRTNITLHKQIVDLLEESGTDGMIMTELSSKLGDFDKRTIDLLLTRAERQTPPSHLSDLGIAIIMENYGRERRNRYFTVASYRQLLANENLDAAAAGYGDVDLSQAGGFATLNGDMFYDDDVALAEYHDTFLEKQGGAVADRTKKKSKQVKMKVVSGTPKTKAKDDEAAIHSDKETATHAAHQTPAIEPPKRGRKRKQEDTGDHSRTTKRGKTSAVQQEAADTSRQDTDSQTLQGPPESARGQTLVADVGSPNVESGQIPTTPGVPTTSRTRKRGRPRKDKRIADALTIDKEPTVSKIGAPPPNSRGRQSAIIDKEMHAAALSTSTIPSTPKGFGRRGSLVADGMTIREEGTSMSEKRGRPSPDIEPMESLPKRTRTRSAKALAADQQQLYSPDAPRIVREKPNLKPSTPAPSSAQPSLSTPGINLPPSDPFESPLSSVPLTPVTPPRRSASSEYGSNVRADSAFDSTVPIDPLLLPGSAMNTVDLPHQPRTAKANVSHMRRGNEFYQLIVNFGGIVNVNSKEFADAHLVLIENLAQAGEPTSAPVGARVDKRTVFTTLEAMESKGRVKTLKTQIMTRTGVPRPTTVVHLPDIDQAALVDFLSNLSDTAPIPSGSNIRRIEEPVEYGAVRLPETRSVLPLQLLREKEPGDALERWSKNDQRADQLWQYDDSTIRDVLLTERTTAAQYYGYIVGRAARLRRAHLLTLSAFQSGDSSPSIVSHQDRIIHLDFYNQDLPLDVYLSLCAALSYNDALSRFYCNDHDAKTPVKSLPPVLHTLLQINRSRARSRFLDIMQSLMYLQVVTPLQPTDSATPAIRCKASNGHPECFDIASLDGWTPSTPNTAPSYWHFTLETAIFTWPTPDSSPKLLKNVPVVTHAQAIDFWEQLKGACLRKGNEIGALTPDSGEPFPLHDSLTQSLRRISSWNDQYFLTWHQKQYLARALRSNLDRSQVQPPVVDSAKLAWITAAPRDVVEKFISDAQGQYDKVIAKARRKRDRLKADKAMVEANKMLIAGMAAEARAQRESEWDTMVARVHPEPLKGSAEVRLRPVRKMFLQAVTIKNVGKWEEEIRQTLREAALAASSLLTKRPKKSGPGQASTVRPSSSATDFLSPPVVHNPIEKSVADLIAQQGPAIPEKSAPPKKRKRGKKDQEEEPQPSGAGRRRHRFQWDNDYEELARDASVIIKARCRALPRLELAALDQVFPSVPRNTVRQRIVHIRDSPGNEAYLKRLEDKWYELWLRHRGTALLPDDDPQSASNFDLPNHIEFLRRHIDKNALRVGFTDESNSVTIPETVDKLMEAYEVVEPPVTSVPWDFVWRVDAEEGREKALAQQPFCKSHPLPCVVQEDESEHGSIAEAALKMVFGTPNERYNPETAAGMLRSVGEETVSAATKALLSRGVLSKHVRDPKREKPGRRLKIADANQNALGGSTSSDTFQDAVALDEDVYLQQESTWRTWPLLGTDGDLASLLQQVSDHKVDLRIDTSGPRAARSEVEWNSKRADDDQIETSIEVRFLDLDVEGTTTSPSPPVLDTVNEESNEPDHGTTSSGDAASCRQANSATLTDCLLCLAKHTDILMSSQSQEDADIVRRILIELEEVGEKGISTSDLWGRLEQYSLESILEHVLHLTDGRAPVAFFAGYNHPVVVSSHHLKTWSVLVCDNPVKKVLPRRWLDMSGSKITEVWDAALRAVIGAIHFRPGITQAELRWRLRTVYDRQEINDVLLSLEADGFVHVIRVDLRLARDERMLDVDEAIERSTYCFINHAKHWYMV